ncbi:prefoldin subunit alpha [Candidatus Woesearchaeota archaeon]|nr:prefoldin subunit alpha [Candidatus Woesearchaeota archaeon]
MTEKKQDQKALESKYLEHQALSQQLKQLENQLQTVDGQILEIKTIDEGIDNIKKTKTGEETLIPISSGIFMKCNILDTKKFLINVGNGVVVEKSADETRDLLNKQLDELEKIKKQMSDQFQQIILQLTEIEKQMNELISEQG